MKTIYDIQQFLKRYGTIIYLGDRLSDLELMETEFDELFRSQLIDIKEYQTGKLLLRQEILKERDKRNK